MKTIIANWKMNVGVRESVALARAALLTLRGRNQIPELIICPPFVALSEVRKVIARSHVLLGAQNMSWEDQGAFTGEISSRMLTEIGVTHVILGHSERRTMLGETDEMIHRKVRVALEHDLIPVICVGESKAQREQGIQFDVVQDQIKQALQGIKIKHAQTVFIAYEPLWAIGTGQSAELSDVLEMHAFIHERWKTVCADAHAPVCRVLYGGSVDVENAYLFLREGLIDGVLVGGASVKLSSFQEIVSAASEVLDAQSSV